MDTTITLQEGIERFQKKNIKIFSKREDSDKAKQFLACHDVAHVVFGCDTSIFGEGMVKLWTIFGTTLGFWKHLRGYSDANAFTLFRMYSWKHIMKNIFQLFSAIPLVIIRANRMNKKWPWTNFEPYLNMPIEVIRAEFNIQPVERRN